MKKYVYLSEKAGYGEGSRCRREKVSGRIELLTAFFDGEPFWFVRIRGLKDTDREYLKLYGNGHWRFLYREDAEAKFKELTTLPRYVKEEQRARHLRDIKKQRMLEAIRQGKVLPPFGKRGKSEDQQ